jgi:hypothetical protein
MTLLQEILARDPARTTAEDVEAAIAAALAASPETAAVVPCVLRETLECPEPFPVLIPAEFEPCKDRYDGRGNSPDDELITYQCQSTVEQLYLAYRYQQEPAFLEAITAVFDFQRTRKDFDWETRGLGDFAYVLHRCGDWCEGQYEWHPVE